MHYALNKQLQQLQPQVKVSRTAGVVECDHTIFGILKITDTGMALASSSAVLVLVVALSFVLLTDVTNSASFDRLPDDSLDVEEKNVYIVKRDSFDTSGWCLPRETPCIDDVTVVAEIPFLACCQGKNCACVQPGNGCKCS